MNNFPKTKRVLSFVGSITQYEKRIQEVSMNSSDITIQTFDILHNIKPVAMTYLCYNGQVSTAIHFEVWKM
jgi:hypothetical protein